MKSEPKLGGTAVFVVNRVALNRPTEASIHNWVD